MLKINLVGSGALDDIIYCISPNQILTLSQDGSREAFDQKTERVESQKMHSNGNCAVLASSLISPHHVDIPVRVYPNPTVKILNLEI